MIAWLIGGFAASVVGIYYSVKSTDTSRPYESRKAFNSALLLCIIAVICTVFAWMR